ncbi:arylalkylamine N-acetyltransferase-like 2 [Eurosta solidaginis]|uniref:arylalkylamine N-acetyltransferase-like 2 n=1 Tax=Eurosta solidaginis TaxID=178769 RepID=UPI003530C08D
MNRCKKVGERTEIVDKKSTAEMDDIEIYVIKLADQKEVLNFLRKHYYPEEPLTIGREPKTQDAEDEKFQMSQILHGTCLMAVQTVVACNDNASDERIVGVLLSGPKSNGEAEDLFEEAERLGSTKWGTILRVLAYAERETNVFKRYNISKALHIHCLAVDVAARGCSVGLRLIEQLMNIGRQLEYLLMTLDCTSYYSAKLCERLEMECINVIKYDEYLDCNGKPIYTPPAPHESLKTFATRLL